MVTPVKETRNWRGEARALLLRAEADYLAALGRLPSQTADAMAWEHHYEAVAAVAIRSASSLQQAVRGIDGGTWARHITRVSRAFARLGRALQRRDFAAVNTSTTELASALQEAKAYLRDPPGSTGYSAAAPAQAVTPRASRVPAGWTWAALTEREQQQFPRWAKVLAAAAVALMVLLALAPSEAPHGRPAPPDLSNSQVNPG